MGQPGLKFQAETVPEKSSISMMCRTTIQKRQDYIEITLRPSLIANTIGANSGVQMRELRSLVTMIQL